MSTEMITLYTTVGSCLLAIVVYFLKRTMSKVDSHENRVQAIEKNYVEKKELGEVKKELQESTQKITRDVNAIQQNYLTKEDFYRSQAATDKKLDRIYDLILEMKGDSAHGKE